MYDAFDARGITVIAVAQEDTDLAKHGQITGKVPGEPRFELVADLNRAVTARYDRVTTYVIDAKGVVQQVMPQMVRRRVDWAAVLNEADRLKIGTAPVAAAPATGSRDGD